jgi:hypothetical protein
MARNSDPARTGDNMPRGSNSGRRIYRSEKLVDPQEIRVSLSRPPQGHG